MTFLGPMELSLDGASPQNGNSAGLPFHAVYREETDWSEVVD